MKTRNKMKKLEQEKDIQQKVERYNKAHKCYSY